MRYMLFAYGKSIKSMEGLISQQGDVIMVFEGWGLAGVLYIVED